MEKYTKKASAYIMKHLIKINPKISKLTSYDQAYVLMMDTWDLEGEMMMKDHNNVGLFRVWRDDEVVDNIWFDDKAWSDKAMDFEWNIIYKTVLERIIKNKLWKRPKLGKREMKKKLAEKEALKEKQREEEQTTTQVIPVSYEDLKKQKMKVYNKLSQLRKKEGPQSEITKYENELNEIKKQLKSLKK